ncbi:MAG: discoidin domain-containing protein, partial [Clostridiales bacterium]|nr:discoidin domain-containing protein [Clostridiales bacterium]
IGQWYHLAVVVDREAGTYKLYINGRDFYLPGEFTADNGFDGLAFDSDLPFNIGQDGTGAYSGNRLVTTYDEFAIFKKALTHEEVAALYALNAAEGAAAPAAEEPAAPTYPSSGADGTIINGTVIGNAEGWGGNAAAGAAAAFDGDPATFFDPLGVGDGFCGIDAGESYILDKVVILSRDGWNSRFPGAMIQGSSDGENWTTLWTSDAEGTFPDYYTVTDFENNTGYSQFRYFNETNHGDVAEVEFYGHAGSEAVEEPAAESKGFASVEDAAAGKNVITGYEFISGTNGNGGEGPENLWDGQTSTKFCTGEFPIESIAKLDGTYDITGFTMATANDNADWNGRSPSAWTISVSSDGENWTELASGDDSFFEETNFTYYTGEGKASGVSYVKFNAEGAPSGCFQVSEVTLFGDKAADVTEELTTKEEAPQTFDFGIVAAVAAVISLAGFAVAKKH